MSQRIEVTIAIDVTPTEDARFLDVGAPARCYGRLGTHICRADANLNGLETEALIEAARKLAANDDVSEQAVLTGLGRVMQVRHLSSIKHVDFAKAIMTLLGIMQVNN